MQITAIVLTKDEEDHIGACLDSLSWCAEILVVDSGSTDQTVLIAEKSGAKVIHHDFNNFSEQRNFAMSQASEDWILFVDADERVTEELRLEIQNTPLNYPKMYRIPRQTIFFGNMLKYSGTQNDAPLRLFPKSDVKWNQAVHETAVSNLPELTLSSKLYHYTTKNLEQWQYKLMIYLPLELETMKEAGKKVNRFHPYLHAAYKFVRLFIIQKGFLDGSIGFQYAKLAAYYDYKRYSEYIKITRNRDGSS